MPELAILDVPVKKIRVHVPRTDYYEFNIPIQFQQVAICDHVKPGEFYINVNAVAGQRVLRQTGETSVQGRYLILMERLKWNFEIKGIEPGLYYFGKNWIFPIIDGKYRSEEVIYYEVAKIFGFKIPNNDRLVNAPFVIGHVWYIDKTGMGYRILQGDNLSKIPSDFLHERKRIQET